jgi:hypothetical protein
MSKKPYAEKAQVYKKYTHLVNHVSKLETSTITTIYKEHKGPYTFYPIWGLFFNEFAIGYTFQSHSK